MATDGVSTVTSLPTQQLSRSQILQVTSRCLHEMGYDMTTIRQIASRLGCAVGSIYRYFQDKHELLYAVTQQILKPVEHLLDSGGSFHESVDLYLRIAREDAEAYRLLFWLACASRNQPQSAALPEIVEQIIARWAQQLDGGAKLARRCWAMIHGSIMLGEEPAQITPAIMVLVRASMPAAPAPAQPPAPAPVLSVREIATSPQGDDDVCLL